MLEQVEQRAEEMKKQAVILAQAEILQLEDQVKAKEKEAIFMIQNVIL